MKEIGGVAAGDGAAIGTVFFYDKIKYSVDEKKADDIASEIARFVVAVEKVKHELTGDAARASEESNGYAAIFNAHALVLDGYEFRGAVIEMITAEMVTAEYAVITVSDRLADVFEKMDDPLFRARAEDMRELAERVISALNKEACGPADEIKANGADEPVILVADSVTAADMIKLSNEQVCAVVTGNGAVLSHAAIIAGAKGIIYLTGVEVSNDWNGMCAIVDASQGKIIIAPDAEVVESYKKTIAERTEGAEQLKALIGKPDVTKDGKHIELYANIGSSMQADTALENDATGIGLFRSELMYFDRDDYPSEDELFEEYKSVAQKMSGKRVIIRTLDIGSDKKADYFGIGEEDNPALGYRAIRVCMDRIDIFKTQLRAIYRASAYGNVAVMIPMIISADEVREVRSLCGEVCDELKSEGIAYSKVDLGIMIETPAAVMISDILAREVDFFSIGTNDLTQFTLAVDRQNSRLTKQYDPYHEAIIRMIRMVVENAHSNGCKVGICGELAADTSMTQELIRIGIDELSVSPEKVLSVRKAILEASNVLN